MAAAAIEIEGLSHSYNGRAALEGLSLQVRQGEIFGLLGPNGSGKTTLFRILSTLMLPQRGRARVMGCDAAAEAAALRRRIGVVFQAHSLDVKLTAAENLRHQGHLYGLRGGELRRRIDDMLRRVGLAERAGERVETFSGGMQRRLEVAKGMLHSPAALLLDEPSTGLDPGARRDLWENLRELREQQGVTILLTTHLMEEAERCDRLGILHQGKLVALGTPAELKREIGGDVVLLDAREPERLAASIAERMGVTPAVLGGRLRLERENGHRFASAVMEAFPGEVEAISVSKPTLEDVFIHRTGHRFWSDARPAEERIESR
jgi:ABC-2 type transport system ATP-binding protein